MAAACSRRAFEESAACLAQVTDRTPVSRLLGISWVAVGNIVERVVARRLDGAPARVLAGYRRTAGDHSQGQAGLTPGDNTIEITLTADDGDATRSYSLVANYSAAG